MADATFQDVLKETKRTNEILKQNAKETQQPDPLRHIKEEAITMVIERKRFKQSIALDKKRTEAADAADEQRDKQSSQDSKYYRQQVREQGATTSSQEDTEKGVRKGSIERFKQNDDVYAEQLRTSKILQDLFRFQTGMNNRQLQQQRQADAESQLEQTTTQNTFDKFKDTLGKINNKLTPYAKFGKKLFELTGIGALGKKIRGGAGSVFSFLKSGIGKLIGGGLIIGMLTFFNSKLFKDIVKWFEKDGLQVIADFYDDVFLPVFKNGIKFVVDLFTGVKEFFESPRFNKTRQLFKDGKIFSAIGEGLDTIIDFAGEQFGIKDLAGKIRTGFEAVYNSLAATLNGVISTLEFFGADVGFRLPKLINGKFVRAAGDMTADEQRFGKMSKESMEDAVFKKSRGMKVDLDELGFEGTAQQRKARLELINLKERQGRSDIFGFNTEAAKATERALSEGITDPKIIKKLEKGFATQLKAQEDIEELEANRKKLLQLQRAGADTAQAGLSRADFSAADLAGRKDISVLLKELNENLQDAKERAQKGNIIVNEAITNAPTTNVPQVVGEGSPYMGPASSTVDLLTGVGGIRL